MGIVNTIKEQQITARKLRESKKAAFLSTLIAEIEIIGKNDGNRVVTDDEAIKVIQKFKKGATEMVVQLNKLGKDISEISEELDILDQFLPKQASDEEMMNEIMSLAVSSNLEISQLKLGVAIKHLKDKFGPSFDASRVKNLPIWQSK